MTPSELQKAIKRAAIAAHDTLYSIGPSTSDMSLEFERDPKVVRAWQEVVLSILDAIEEV